MNLKTAGNYVILAKTGITNTGASTKVTGDIGVYPAASITGFDLTPVVPDSTTVFSTSPQVTGKVYASDYVEPTPTNLTTAVGDMLLAYDDAAGRTADVTLQDADIGGKTLVPGVYKWTNVLLIKTDVTFNGNATDVWIFQIAGGLTMSSGVKIILAGGALPENIFWQVADVVNLNTTAQFEGVVLTKKEVTLETGASVNGRLLAQTDVTMQANTVVEP